MNKRYKITYYFDGKGEIEFLAKDEENAREKFYDGDWDGNKETEWGDTYNIDEVEELKSRSEIKKENVQEALDNLPELEEGGYKVERFTDLHWRINSVLDIWISTKRFWLKQENAKGNYSNLLDLLKEYNI